MPCPNEQSNLLPPSLSDSGGRRHRFRRWACCEILACIAALAVITLLAVTMLGPRFGALLETRDMVEADLLSMTKNRKSPSSSPLREYQRNERMNCNAHFGGAWFEACFLVSDPNGVFPGMQGLLSFPILILRAPDGGFDLYGYSIRNPFFEGNDYWELGHGTPSQIESPTPNSHCKAHFKSKLRVGEEWSSDDGDYYWNFVSKDSMFVGNGKDATCFYRRLKGRECRDMVHEIIQRFKLVNITIDISSEKNSCGA